jgi:uncharacterized protein YlbG (UPF0298 family)
MRPNNYAMKGWHLKHAETTIVRYANGLSPDASAFERRNYKKYGTIAHCVKQLEYDMMHGVEKSEVMEIFRKIRLAKKYAKLQSNADALARLQQLEDQLSGVQKIAEDQRFLWHRNAYRA